MDNIVRDAQEDFIGGVQMKRMIVLMILFAGDILLLTKEDKDIENNLHGSTAYGNGEKGHEHLLGDNSNED